MILARIPAQQPDGLTAERLGMPVLPQAPAFLGTIVQFNRDIDGISHSAIQHGGSNRSEGHLVVIAADSAGSDASPEAKPRLVMVRRQASGLHVGLEAKPRLIMVPRQPTGLDASLQAKARLIMVRRQAAGLDVSLEAK